MLEPTSVIKSLCCINVVYLISRVDLERGLIMVVDL